MNPNEIIKSRILSCYTNLDLIKSHNAMIGEVHTWADGTKHRKTINGWEEVVEGKSEEKKAVEKKDKTQENINKLIEAYNSKSAKSVKIAGVEFKIVKPEKGYRGRDFYINGKYEKTIDDLEQIEEIIKDKLDDIKSGKKEYKESDVKYLLTKKLKEAGLEYSSHTANTGSTYYTVKGKKIRVSDHTGMYRGTGDNNYMLFSGNFSEEELNERLDSIIKQIS